MGIGAGFQAVVSQCKGVYMLKLSATMLSVVFSAIFCSPADAKFVVAWSAVSALNSPFWVMQDGGFFKKEGLDVELVYIASSPTVARATLPGTLSYQAPIAR